MNASQISQIISLVIVLVLVVLGVVFTIWKSKKYTIVKLLGILIFASFALTWVFSYGYFNGSEFADYGFDRRQGLFDTTNVIYYALQFAADKIIYLLALGGFYGVLSKCKCYRKLVKNVANAFKGIEVIFIIISSLFITLLTSVLTQTFVVLFFVPFIISVILAMNLDKLTAFACTFGAMLVGVLGMTYGGEGHYWFNDYVGATVTTAILYRVILLVVGFVLFNFFNCLHAKKVLAEKNNKEKVEDPFEVEEIDKKEKAHVWPFVISIIIVFAIFILGYVDWEANFGITVFNDFHEWLFGITFADIPLLNKIPWASEFAPFKAFLGVAADSQGIGTTFGKWTLFYTSVVLMVLTAIYGIFSKMKLDEFISSFAEGMKKMCVPTLLFVGAYIVMMAAYMSPFVPTITNIIGGKTFNPYLISVNALIANIFHIDFGFTGYVVATYYTTTFANNLEVIHTIYSAIYGLVGFFAPTSAILLIGLAYLNIDYKKWMKYSWMFTVAMIVISLVLVTVMAYV